MPLETEYKIWEVLLKMKFEMKKNLKTRLNHCVKNYFPDDDDIDGKKKG